MAKKIKKIKKDSKKERHRGIVLEDIDSKLDLVVEGQQALDQKFIKKIEGVNEQLGDIDYKLNVHTDTLNTHTEMIGSMKVDIEIIKKDIDFIKHSLKRKVDIEEFEFLEKRVIRLEKVLQSRR